MVEVAGSPTFRNDDSGLPSSDGRPAHRNAGPWCDRAGGGWPMFAPEGYKGSSTEQEGHRRRQAHACLADTLKMQLDCYVRLSTLWTGQRPFEMGEKSMDILLAIKKGGEGAGNIYTRPRPRHQGQRRPTLK